MGGASMAMSPMTASIMSAVPESRAGAGSSMNDATREVGAALGIAVLGSLAASQYTGSMHGAFGRLPAASRGVAETSLAGALQVAGRLPTGLGHALATTAQTAFTDGVRFASAVGVVLCLVAAFITYRFLPKSVEPRGPMHSAVNALENGAEFGIGGTLPVFADDPEPTVPSTT
jgi:hypothetical protein